MTNKQTNKQTNKNPSPVVGVHEAMVGYGQTGVQIARYEVTQAQVDDLLTWAKGYKKRWRRAADDKAWEAFAGHPETQRARYAFALVAAALTASPEFVELYYAPSAGEFAAMQKWRARRPSATTAQATQAALSFVAKGDGEERRREVVSRLVSATMSPTPERLAKNLASEQASRANPLALCLALAGGALAIFDGGASLAALLFFVKTQCPRGYVGARDKKGEWALSPDFDGAKLYKTEASARRALARVRDELGGAPLPTVTACRYEVGAYDDVAGEIMRGFFDNDPPPPSADDYAMPLAYAEVRVNHFHKQTQAALAAALAKRDKGGKFYAAARPKINEEDPSNLARWHYVHAKGGVLVFCGAGDKRLRDYGAPFATYDEARAAALAHCEATLSPQNFTPLVATMDGEIVGKPGVALAYEGDIMGDTVRCHACGSLVLSGKETARLKGQTPSAGEAWQCPIYCRYAQEELMSYNGKGEELIKLRQRLVRIHTPGNGAQAGHTTGEALAFVVLFLAWAGFIYTAAVMNIPAVLIGLHVVALVISASAAALSAWRWRRWKRGTALWQAQDKIRRQKRREAWARLRAIVANMTTANEGGEGDMSPPSPAEARAAADEFARRRRHALTLRLNEGKPLPAVALPTEKHNEFNRWAHANVGASDDDITAAAARIFGDDISSAALLIDTKCAAAAHYRQRRQRGHADVFALALLVAAAVCLFVLFAVDTLSPLFAALVAGGLPVAKAADIRKQKRAKVGAVDIANKMASTGKGDIISAANMVTAAAKKLAAFTDGHGEEQAYFTNECRRAFVNSSRQYHRDTLAAAAQVARAFADVCDEARQAVGGDVD